MGKVTLTVNGRKFSLGCDDGEEARLSALGERLDKRVSALADQFGQIGDLQLLLMAGITMLDEIDDADSSVNSRVEEKAAEIQRAGEDALNLARRRELQATDSLIEAAERIERLAERLKR